MEHGTPAELTDVRKFISDLNLLRRHIQSYPAGHPIVEESLKRVFGKLHQIVVLGGSLVIGVAGSVLMVNDSPVESKEPAIRDFTRSLFGLGIMSITFRPDVTAEGLRALNQILMMGQDALQSSGGLQAILAAAPLQDIDIKTMDYGALSVQHGVLDDDASVQGDFWERFVRAVTRGAAAGASDLAGQSREVAEPEMLASLLAGLIEDKQWSASVPAMLGLLKRFLKEADEESYVHDPQALGKFVRFLHVLKPEVRDYFLQSSFDALSNRTVVAERILDGFSIELLGDALNKGMTSEGFAPPSIVAIMKRLARTKNIPVGEEKDGSQLAESLLDNESLERMQVVFQEEDRDKFVPQEYDETLRDLLESVKQSSPDEDDIEQLRTGLLEHSIDVKMSAIILEIIDAEIGGEHDSQSLGGDLMELCDGFIRVGDFRAVTDVFNRLKQFGDVSGRRHAMLATFSRPELIDEVLKTPEIWGKDKFKDIATFIKTVGLPFVEPMLDRLAVEEKMSLRRFYMDRIIDCGPNAVGAVSARLDDPRWYYVRNLIVILRGIGSSQAAPFLRNARHHTHARVRHEL
ncbi:MAG TPA: hypothetical protein VK445_05045, partial [Dissulfurispiraceae bacterium]|nr:hypothetical protein [Dissulfurispiraceae bacterium]